MFDWSNAAEVSLTDRNRLELAFEALDQQGVRAREDFTCCQSCGHSEMASDPDVAEYVFYHGQDSDSFFTEEQLDQRSKNSAQFEKNGGDTDVTYPSCGPDDTLHSPLYLSYGIGPAHPVFGGKQEDVDAAEVELGYKIVRTLHAYGFLVRWDGSIKTTIEVEHNDRLRYVLGVEAR